MVVKISSSPYRDMTKAEAKVDEENRTSDVAVIAEIPPRYSRGRGRKWILARSKAVFDFVCLILQMCLV